MKKHRLDAKALKSGTPKGPAKPPPSENPNKRPKHKAAIHLARLNAERDKRRPEPMFEFQRRIDNKYLDSDIDTVRILKREATLGRIEKAAIADAEWNNSDPFAYGRTALYVKQGWIDPEKHVEELHKRTLARRVAREREVDSAKNAQTT